jgi:phosphatidylglycerophosphate synthase
MSTLSYQEKSLYGTLAADLLVYIPYFVYVMHHPTTLTHIVGTIILLIVTQIILQSIIAIASRSRITDERDRQIAGLGFRNAYFALVGMMLTGMGLLWLHGNTLNPNHMGLHFLSVFFGMIVISELVKIISQLIAYRRSI